MLPMLETVRELYSKQPEPANLVQQTTSRIINVTNTISNAQRACGKGTPEEGTSQSQP